MSPWSDHQRPQDRHTRPLATPAPGTPSPWQRLADWVVLEREDIAAIFIYGGSVSLLGLAAPVVVQALVTTVAFGSVLQPLLVLAIMLLVALGFSSALKGLQIWVAEALQRRLFVRVVSDLAHRLPRVRPEAWDGRHPPEVLNRFFDVFIIQKKSVSLLLGGVEVVLTLLVGTLVLALYHPAFLVFDLVLVVLVGVLVFGRIRIGGETARVESSAKYAMVALLQEIAQHPEAVKLASGPAWVRQKVDLLASGYLEARRKHFRVLFGQTAGVLTLYAVASAVALGAGGWLVMERAITLGQLVAAELVVTALVGALVQLGKYLESFYDLLAAVDKVGYVVDLEVENLDGDGVDLPDRTSLRLTGISCADAGRPILQDLDLAVDAGGRLVLQGPDRAGRTRLLELLAGLRQPDQGVVALEGRDVRDIAPQDIHRRVMLIGRPALFSGTILENLAMGDETLTRGRASAWLLEVGLDAELLPEGLDTELQAEGKPLDAPACVRLAVARAAVASPTLLLLDGTLDGLPETVLEHLCPFLVRADQPWTLVVASDDARVRQRLGKARSLREGRLEGGEA
ncbi:MAG: ABC transporter ATP-binding protein [Candidatus Sericytochromatia bacterium]|nr:ABC transporter ATP-binding protein [Candidatus Sericytochromatia bacterium]